MSPVRLAPEVLAQLAACVDVEAPQEFVGLLGGQPGAVLSLVPLPNRAIRGDRFAVEPLAFAQAEHALRQRGQRWLGFVHSHPHGDVRLSGIDRAELWRDCLQLVAARGRQGELLQAAYWLAARGVRQLPMLVADGARA